MADSRIYLSTQPLIPVGNHSSAPKADFSKGKDSFADVLANVNSQVVFSQHAQQRMQSRNLQLTKQEQEKLSEAVDKVAAKGAKESLVYLNNMAFVVSVPNRTVITAMDGTSARENVFTNIDSAVIL
jgi:flagellar operon protein